ncbi:hypothetical protein LEN_1978 [Lysobacter enzymogenes]|uniref:Uncharacterized protein n=1 Tax=Lysobacter enzymogenes TaxID=69 RepID=A0AAU9AJK4_LYSEN|nr:hypothetical protein LEN_1978 [Lysobacter enzymogenes]
MAFIAPIVSGAAARAVPERGKQRAADAPVRGLRARAADACPGDRLRRPPSSAAQLRSSISEPTSGPTHSRTPPRATASALPAPRRA